VTVHVHNSIHVYTKAVNLIEVLKWHCSLFKPSTYFYIETFLIQLAYYSLTHRQSIPTFHGHQTVATVTVSASKTSGIMYVLLFSPT
jgi:hypothetical protein